MQAQTSRHRPPDIDPRDPSVRAKARKRGKRRTRVASDGNRGNDLAAEAVLITPPEYEDRPGLLRTKQEYDFDFKAAF